MLVRVLGIEPSSRPWEGRILATIRYPHGAEDGTRTHDLLVTNELLYQLSYFGISCKHNANQLLVLRSVSEAGS